MVTVRLATPVESTLEWEHDVERLRRPTSKVYADPMLNRIRLNVTIRCSMAVTRDWHRHRTMYPLEFILVRNIDNGAFLLDPHYEPISEHGKEWHTGYWVNCRDAYEYFSKAGDWGKAMLCIPFGAQVELSCQMGLRDFLYTFELRAFTKGANFEYQEQARWALLQLRQLFEESGDLGRDIARGLQLPKGG